MSYLFRKSRDENNKHDVADIEMAIKDSDASLDTIFENFALFLLGCGFSRESLKKYVDSEVLE